MPKLSRSLSRLFPCTRRLLAVFSIESDALRYARERAAEGRRIQVLTETNGYAVRVIGGLA